ncbi:glycosyltransferase, partial [Escherichia coli]
MKISVITVTYNNAEGLEKTLSSLSILKIKPFEIIIVDG